VTVGCDSTFSVDPFGALTRLKTIVPVLYTIFCGTDSSFFVLAIGIKLDVLLV